MKGKSLNIAIVGCGEQSWLQAEAIRKSGCTSLAKVMDVSRVKAKKLGDEFEVEYTDEYEKVLSSEGVDVVFLITPHYLHAEQAVQAAQAGKHLIVEKPLSTSYQDATRMVQSAERNGTYLSMWLGFRYRPHVVRANQLVKQGILGTVQGAQLTFQRNKPSSYYRSGKSAKDVGWRGRLETSGGGVLIMNAIHYLDWITHLTGLNVKKVSCKCGTLGSYNLGDDGIGVEDSVSLWFELDNGAIGTANISSAVQGVGDNKINDIRIWGTEGHLVLAPPHQFYSSRMVDNKKPGRWHYVEPESNLRSPKIKFLEEYAHSVLKEEPLSVGTEEALHLQAVVEAAYESSRQERPVSVRDIEALN